MAPARCSPLSSSTTFDADFVMVDEADIEGPKAIALRLGVRAQWSLAHAMSALQHSPSGKGAEFWLDEASQEIAGMRSALESSE